MKKGAWLAAPFTYAILGFSTTAAGMFYGPNGEIAPCDSTLFCWGDMLRDIQSAHRYADSKTFLDMPTKKPAKEIEEAFRNLRKQGPIKNNTHLQTFLDEHFHSPGQELLPVTNRRRPVDISWTRWIIIRIKDHVIQDFVHQVITKWPNLLREYDQSGLCEGCESSFIPLKYPFIIPGGRFREMHYWDSFWIIEGLLSTKLEYYKGVARSMIFNFLDLVERYGFVPGGSRKYYLNRSQPPMLPAMVWTYVNYTGDTEILDWVVPLLIREHDFWMSNRIVEVSYEGETHLLNQYNVRNNQPRPESYAEDLATLEVIGDGSKPRKEELFSNLAGAAESGWDFSSRWLMDPTSRSPLSTTNTNNIVPVDLNSILYQNEMTIASFLQSQSKSTAAKHYEALATNRSESMYKLFWDHKHKRYFDFNTSSGERNLYYPLDETLSDQNKTKALGKQVVFSPYQLFPFWTSAVHRNVRENADLIKQSFKPVRDHLAKYPGGIPATNLITEQQWDENNAWPPLQYVTIQAALGAIGNFEERDWIWDYLMDIAHDVAQRYVDTTFCTWWASGGHSEHVPKFAVNGKSSAGNGVMFEKYRSSNVSGAGSGGEYEVATGFGWTNGVLIWVADQFGDRLRRPRCPADMEVIPIVDPNENEKAPSV